jgi:putative spermidine/putrescine transport system ATP-binding protein
MAMAGLRIDQVSKTYLTIQAVKDVSIEVPQGQFVCLLGPSGCGKTTLLRMIAGLEEPTSGRILLDDEDLTRVPAHQRNFGMVFQSLALFPHLSVGENIAYSLTIRGASKEERRKRADELLELVRLPGSADRPVSQLSGGQRQRVAIARALAFHPRLFLLDEPLSALDAKLREAMQVELRQLQQRLGISTIVVTHDQREAMTMADIVVIMREGVVQQMAPPIDIYRRPANAFVADFIGLSNILPAVADGADGITLGGSRFRVEALPAGTGSGTKVMASVRPEDVHLLPAGDNGENTLPAEVTFVRDLGASVEFTLQSGDTSLLATVTPRDHPGFKIGDKVRAQLPASACVVLAS